MRKISLLLFVLFSCGLSNKYIVDVNYDKFDKTTTYVMRNNILAAENAEKALRNMVSMDVCKFATTDSTKIYLIVSHSGKEYLHFQDGKSLVLLIDGIRNDFDLTHRKDATSENPYLETAYYNISQEQFKSLAYASKVDVKIIGHNFHLVRAIHPLILAKYQKFYNEIVTRENHAGQHPAPRIH